MDAMVTFAAKLAGHARTLPDRPAVTCGEDVLTYGELHRRSNRLARGLRAMGVREGDPVNVALPNEVDFVAVSHTIVQQGVTPQPPSFLLPAPDPTALLTARHRRVQVTRVPVLV